MSNINRSLLTTLIVVIAAVAGISWFNSRALPKNNHEKSHEKEIWFCPMHPHYTSDRPGQCPICHMDLVKRKDSPNENKQPVSGLEGYVPVSLDSRQEQLIGMRTALVKKGPVFKTVHAPGYIATGLDLYELQNQFIDAYVQYAVVFRDYKRVKDRRRGWETHRDLQTKLLSAKDALLKLGLSDEQIMKLSKVYWNNIWDQPELLMFQETNSYWVIAQVFEQDMGFVDVGQDVNISINAYHEKARGIVRSVGGIIDPESRTVNALIEIQGYRGELKANMLVQVDFRVELNVGLQVPQAAVMDLGDRKVVFVKKGHGLYEPRAIEVSFLADQDWVVKTGLSEGEEVVVDGNFLLDSESRLRWAVSAGAGGHSHE